MLRPLALVVACLLGTTTALSPKSSSRSLSHPRLERIERPGAANELPTTSLVAAKKSPPVSNTGGVLAMIGGVLLHLTCGSMYCWGNLISYLPAELKYWNPAGGTGPPDAQLVLAFILLAQMTGMPIGPMLEKLVGPRLTAAIGGGTRLRFPRRPRRPRELFLPRPSTLLHEGSPPLLAAHVLCLRLTSSACGLRLLLESPGRQ